MSAEKMIKNGWLSLGEQFWLQVDRLIPAQVRDGDPANLRVARVLVLLSTLGVMFTVPRTIEESFRFGALAPQLHSYYFSLLVLACIPIVMHATKSIALARHLPAVMLILAMPYGISLSGGLYSKDIYSYPLCTWLCVVLCGVRWGSLYSFMIVGQALLVGWLQANGSIDMLVGMETDQILTRSASLAFSCLVGWTAAVIQERSYAAALQRVMASEERAHAANTAKSQFLASMSHDIRTPLNAILGQIDLLRREDSPKEERETLDLMEDNGKLLLGIFEQILDLARLRSGKVSVAQDQIVPNGLLLLIGNTGRLLAARRGVQFVCLPGREPFPPGLVADASRIQQICLNLLTNACKFTEPGRRVLFRLSYTSSSSELRILCADEGVGIPESSHASVFEAFNRGSLTSRGQAGIAEGSGLGLTIVAELTRLLQGRVRLRSAVGKGTIVRVCLPVQKVPAGVRSLHADGPATDDGIQASLSANAAGRADQSQEHDSSVSLNGLRVLSVDDNRLNQLVLGKILARLGCVVTEAMSGEEAVEKAASVAYDLIFMDLQMPGIDGHEAHQRIRSRELARLAERSAGPDSVVETLRHLTPVVALTANADPDVRARCLQEGMAAYLKKPVDHRELKAVLRSVAQSRPGGTGGPASRKPVA